MGMDKAGMNQIGLTKFMDPLSRKISEGVLGKFATNTVDNDFKPVPVRTPDELRIEAEKKAAKLTAKKTGSVIITKDQGLGV